MPQTKRVCVIGAGPCGMSVLFQFNKLKAQGKVIPEIVCFEKQSDWGGLWNYTWQSGTDEFGEPVHGSMYRGLWSNGPKECLEFPDYTFEEHFGKAIPSYPPRAVLLDYLKGRWSKGDLRHFIRYHVVRYVSYNGSTDDFTVTVKILPEDKEFVQKFDYVIVANGHFSTPNVPTFPGIDQFPGRVMHGHEFRNSSQFKGKRLLLVGASYSAEDIALQCLKYGAESIICTWRTKPMGFKWPAQISEKPLLTKIEGNTVHFRDGTSAEVDDIIFCTGYHLYFPFMEECLRLKSRNVLFPEGLYKAILWRHGGNNKVLYMGMVDQYYSFTLFDAQAHWAAKYIMGDLAPPDKKAMEGDCKKWLDRLQEMKGCDDEIDYQTDYLADITKDSSYGYDLDTAKQFHDWEEYKRENIATYRDHSHTSKFTGTKSPVHRDPFMKAFDDSIQNFVGR